MSLPQEPFITHAHAIVERDPLVLAAWLAGSFGTGDADEFSDVDLHLLVDGAVDWRELAEAIVPDAVLIDPIVRVDGCVVITPDWLHLDIVLHQKPNFQAPQRFRPSFDRVGVLSAVPPAPVEPEPSCTSTSSATSKSCWGAGNGCF